MKPDVYISQRKALQTIYCGQYDAEQFKCKFHRFMNAEVKVSF